jgi:ferrous iron transport protein B
MKSVINHLPDQIPAVTSSQDQDSGREYLTIALAGNANVGKSAIFNQLTGLVQETGNWPGKTVSIKEGTLVHHGRQIKIIDLPGIYSFSSYSSEELITRDYIQMKHPDVVINIVDATSLERNLYFTLQLKEMDIPVVIALNFADVAKKKHINIHTKQLGKILGARVISTLAIKGIGVHELIDAALDLTEKKNSPDQSEDIKYGTEIENRITRLSRALAATPINYPRRWAALKLLEKDRDILESVATQFPEIAQLSQKLSDEIADIHKEDPPAVIADERYAAAARIARQVTANPDQATSPLSRFDDIGLDPILGYVIFFIILAAILVFTSFFGAWLTEVITGFFNSINPQWTGPLGEIIWSGAVVGFYASMSVALGFILPFYLILDILAQSGYLPRIAFLMDRPCHLLGLHGQASIPLILAFGCNVPACLSCRILDNKRDRLIATALTTMVPCSARTSVVLGLAGAFIGWQWAVGLLAFQFAVIFVIGRLLSKINPGASPGIIMEIPKYQVPSMKIVLSQSWAKFKDFLTMGVPLIVLGSMVIESLRIFNLLPYITEVLTPITVYWLGLPAFTGILLIFGILRKEANLALLISFAGGAAVTTIISPLQMVVFSLVIMLYIPCISTIAVLAKETGIKITTAIVVGEIMLAILVGGIAYRVLGLFMQ